jgi:hypothetical protein
MTSANPELTPFAYDTITSAPPEVVADILRATHDTYQSAVQTPGAQHRGESYDDIKSSPSCVYVATQISERLNGLHSGYEADTLGVQFQGTAHIISRVKALGVLEMPIIVDATWQQFLPRRNLSLPRKIANKLRGEAHPDVFIGTAKEVGLVALGIGFDEAQAATWADSYLME